MCVCVCGYNKTYIFAVTLALECIKSKLLTHPQVSLSLVISVLEYVFRLSFSPRMCISFVNLVHKISNGRGTRDVLTILIHLGTIVTMSHTFGDKMVVNFISKPMTISNLIVSKSHYTL